MNPIHNQKFNLNAKAIYRNGLPIVRTPITTTSDQPAYFNTLEAQYFLNKVGLGSPQRLSKSHFFRLRPFFNKGGFTRFFFAMKYQFVQFQWSLGFNLSGSMFEDQIYVNS